MDENVPPVLRALNIEQQIEWMLTLGEYLTVSARDSYPFAERAGAISGLMGHNEIQHRLLARVRDLKAGREWTLDSFVRMIAEMAETYDVKSGVERAFRKSLPLDQPQE